MYMLLVSQSLMGSVVPVTSFQTYSACLGTAIVPACLSGELGTLLVGYAIPDVHSKPD